jgi:alkaline phosphatase
MTRGAPYRATVGTLCLVWIGQVLPGLQAATPRNVILFIGDGMGAGEVQAAGLYAYGTTGSLGFERFDHQALTVTYAADGSITDSAAAATAMATGHKVNNGVLSLALPGDGRELTTILEYAQARGKSSGLVTTAYITHATPAAFAAHEPSREDYTAIASDILDKTRPQVLFGGAFHLEGAAAAGYTVIRTEAELGALDTEAVHLISGQFSEGTMTYALDRTPGTTEPTLAVMTRKALAILDNDPNGLFLMVEAGRIDHAGHAHDLARNVQETLSLDQAVQEALAWAAASGQGSDTLILVAADHETGGLRVVSGGRCPWPSPACRTRRFACNAAGPVNSETGRPKQRPISSTLPRPSLPSPMWGPGTVRT